MLSPYATTNFVGVDKLFVSVCAHENEIKEEIKDILFKCKKIIEKRMVLIKQNLCMI